jgi:hypothetical protein
MERGNVPAPATIHHMKKQLPYIAGSLLVAVAVWLGQPTDLPAQGAGEDSEMAAIITEVIAQQDTIAKNHTAIDAKLGVIAEDVRQARLFAARGGGSR